PIVVPDDAAIEVTLRTEDEDVLVTLDGQEGHQIKFMDTVAIKKIKGTTRLILSPKKDYYQILRQKLRWGV
ncbi:MAG TPA: NAD(+) kinase, partial [Nitrospirota bacterium]|nr:NAD(+) kinase [Nitrospirota bacterium]